ncbi:MAG: PQQ-like beta-propeller repeat protein [Cyclobacteriaceae bacterium]
MKPASRYLVLITYLSIISTAYAQENIFDDDQFGFESESGWGKGDTLVFEISDEKSASGSKALKYELPEDVKSVEIEGLYSIETGYTISKVRTAIRDNNQYIVASSYEGTMLGVSFDGVILWKNELSGFMNRDVWTADITGDENDEILTANSDGTLYCLNHFGQLLWEYKKNEAPLSSVCVIKVGSKSHIVFGSYDRNVYYLNTQGEEVKVIDASTYSKDKPWGKPPPTETAGHIPNFVRPFHKSTNEEALVVQGAMHTSSAPGYVYLFNPMEDTPYESIKLESGGTIGHMDVLDTDGDGADEFVLGSNGFLNGSTIFHVNPKTGIHNKVEYSSLWRQISGFGYRHTMCTIVPKGDDFEYFSLFGSDISLTDSDGDVSDIEILSSSYSYNDMWNAGNDKIIMASAQSGGSCIHVINLSESEWKQKYERLVPPGKITKMLNDADRVQELVKTFKKPEWEGENRKVRLFTEARSSIEDLVEYYKDENTNPIFYLNKHTGHAENWDRSNMGNATYAAKRDGRRTYDWTQQESLDFFHPQYEDELGVSFWGGHGTDPYIFSRPTVEKIIDYGYQQGKETNVTYPELESHDADAQWMLNDLIYPLAEHARGKNTTLYIRTKHTFWNSIIYKPLWSRLVSGEFSDIFIPSMEETNTKMVDISIASRVGIWMSGAVDQWGSRCARDNTSYDRLREVSHQMLPNHFLRQTIYHLAYGASNQNNFAVDQRYFSIVYEMINKGVLYVPKREEIVSISPVHLSMLEPEDAWIDRNNEVKWTVLFDQQYENNNPAVISRGGGEWPGAPVTEWDYSRYAAGSKERRLESLPNFENGLVIFTPPQSGVNADLNAPRGKLTEHMHPLYKDIMKEYFTDGDNYYSSEGTQVGTADQYYTVVESDIKDQSKKLPLTVKGRVAWVTAQTSPRHLRLTLVDGGYINPDDREAIITFHTSTPVKLTDLLSGETFDISDPTEVKVKIPCGGFRFIDVEIRDEL